MNPACSGPVAGYSKKQAKSLICGRSSLVERQLPKLWLSAAIQGVSCSGFCPVYHQHSVDQHAGAVQLIPSAILLQKRA